MVIQRKRGRPPVHFTGDGNAYVPKPTRAQLGAAAAFYRPHPDDEPRGLGNGDRDRFDRVKPLDFD